MKNPSPARSNPNLDRSSIATPPCGLISGDSVRGLSPLKQLQRMKDSPGATIRPSRTRTNRPCTTMMIGYSPAANRHCIGTGQCGAGSGTATSNNSSTSGTKTCDSSASGVRTSASADAALSLTASPDSPPVAVLPAIVVRRPAPPDVPTRTSSVRPSSDDSGCSSGASPSKRSSTAACSDSSERSGSSPKLPQRPPADTDSGCPPNSFATPIKCFAPVENQSTDHGETPLEKPPKVEVKLLRPSRVSCRKLFSRSLDHLDTIDSDCSTPASPFDNLDELRSSFLSKEIHLECDTLSRQLFPRTFKESVTDIRQPCKKEHIYSSLGSLNSTLSQSVEVLSSTGDLTETHKDKEGAGYSLPEPQSYGDSTLKAVKRITDKYDSLQMRKMRARSFRAGSNMLTSAAAIAAAAAQADGEQLQDKAAQALLHLQVSTVKEASEIEGTSSAPCSPAVGMMSYSSSSPEVVVPVTTGLTDRDVSRVEMFYRSRSTEVEVCDCLADLQLATTHTGGSDATATVPVASWDLKHTGVPVIVLNTGTGRRKRALHLVLAERETGFPLWSDRVNYLTNYAERSATLHAFHVSTSLRTIAAFSFYSAPAAARFHEKLRRLTSDPEDELWSVSNSKKKRKNKKTAQQQRQQRGQSASPWKRSSSAKVKKVTKNEISQPCHFVHVTNVNPVDNSLLETFADYIHGQQTAEAEYPDGVVCSRPLSPINLT